MSFFKNHAPTVLTYQQIKEGADSAMSQCPNSSNWIPARCYPRKDNLRARIRCAWLVFTGQADALLPVWQEKKEDPAVRTAGKSTCGEGRHG